MCVGGVGWRRWWCWHVFRTSLRNKWLMFRERNNPRTERLRSLLKLRHNLNYRATQGRNRMTSFQVRILMQKQ